MPDALSSLGLSSPVQLVMVNSQTSQFSCWYQNSSSSWGFYSIIQNLFALCCFNLNSPVFHCVLIEDSGFKWVLRRDQPCFSASHFYVLTFSASKAYNPKLHYNIFFHSGATLLKINSFTPPAPCMCTCVCGVHNCMSQSSPPSRWVPGTEHESSGLAATHWGPSPAPQHRHFVLASFHRAATSSSLVLWRRCPRLLFSQDYHGVFCMCGEGLLKRLLSLAIVLQISEYGSCLSLSSVNSWLVAEGGIKSVHKC